MTVPAAMDRISCRVHGCVSDPCSHGDLDISLNTSSFDASLQSCVNLSSMCASSPHVDGREYDMPDNPGICLVYMYCRFLSQEMSTRCHQHASISVVLLGMSQYVHASDLLHRAEAMARGSTCMLTCHLAEEDDYRHHCSSGASYTAFIIHRYPRRDGLSTSNWDLFEMLGTGSAGSYSVMQPMTKSELLRVEGSGRSFNSTYFSPGIMTGKRIGLFSAVRNKEATSLCTDLLDIRGRLNWYDFRVRTMRQTNGLCRDCSLLRRFCYETDHDENETSRGESDPRR